MAENCLGFNYYGPNIEQVHKGKGEVPRSKQRVYQQRAAGGSGNDSESHDGDDDGDKSL